MTAPVLFPDVNLLALLVAVVAAMLIGFVWYAPPVFMGPWLRGIEKGRDQLGKPGPALALTLLMAIVNALGIAILYDWLGRGGVAKGLGAGFFLWLVAALPVTVNTVAFEKRPWVLLPVSAGFYLASHLVIGLVIGLFG